MPGGAFLFYPDDWLASSRIAVMSAAEERGYLRLLLHAWKQPDCGLPNDDATLAVLAKISIRQWKRESGAKILKCFELRDGRLYNERLLREFHNQQEYKRERAEAGRRGAAKRWSDQQADSSANGSAIDSANSSAIFLPSKNPQSIVANGWQNDASASASANKSARGAPIAEPYTQTAAALRAFYPSTDAAFVTRLTKKARAAVTDATDDQIAAAVRATYRPAQRGAGLFLETVPEFLRNPIAAPGSEESNFPGEYKPDWLDEN